MLLEGPMIDAHRVKLPAPDDFEGWRDAARDLAEAGVPASAVLWQVEGGEAELFGQDVSTQSPGAAFPVPRKFVDLARDVICHSDPERFALLYALLLRLKHNRDALGDEADATVRRVHNLAKAVRRDIHKMHAFVRFREIDGRFIAFFEPDHHIVRRAASFFVNRFTNMRWSILTPEMSIHWEGKTLCEGPGASRSAIPAGDPLEDMWRMYYSAIFNPARLKVGAMLKEMPKKYWHNMPETSLIQPLIAAARGREIEMIDRSASKLEPKNRFEIAGPAAPENSVRDAWQAVREAARSCDRCNLCKLGTQMVFGEGPLAASIMFVGEQPGDQEDLAGRPFVGPAGQVFNAALEKVGIDRSTVYVTNAVKHFKFTRRGKQRIHNKPGAGEIEACRWWLEKERRLVEPAVTVALGATAARSLIGKSATIREMRGAPFPHVDGGEVWVTAHPSSLLRIPDRDTRAEAWALFVRDLERIKVRADELANR